MSAMNGATPRIVSANGAFAIFDSTNRLSPIGGVRNAISMLTISTIPK